MSGPRNTIPPLLQYLYQITLHMMARSLRDRPVRGLEQFPELQKYMTTGVSLMKLMKKGKKMIKLTLKETQGTTNIRNISSKLTIYNFIMYPLLEDNS